MYRKEELSSASQPEEKKNLVVVFALHFPTTTTNDSQRACMRSWEVLERRMVLRNKQSFFYLSHISRSRKQNQLTKHKKIVVRSVLYVRRCLLEYLNFGSFRYSMPYDAVVLYSNFFFLLWRNDNVLTVERDVCFETLNMDIT